MKCFEIGCHNEASEGSSVCSNCLNKAVSHLASLPTTEPEEKRFTNAGVGDDDFPDWVEIHDKTGEVHDFMVRDDSAETILDLLNSTPKKPS